MTEPFLRIKMTCFIAHQRHTTVQWCLFYPPSSPTGETH